MLVTCPNCGKKYLVDLDACPFCQASNTISPDAVMAAEQVMAAKESRQVGQVAQKSELDSLKSGLRRWLQYGISGAIVAFFGALLIMVSPILGVIIALCGLAIALSGTIGLYRTVQ